MAATAEFIQTRVHMQAFKLDGCGQHSRLCASKNDDESLYIRLSMRLARSLAHNQNMRIREPSLWTTKNAI